jgi:hypothetical protein
MLKGTPQLRKHPVFTSNKRIAKAKKKHILFTRIMGELGSCQI